MSYIYIAKDKFSAVANRVSKAAQRVKDKLRGQADQATATGFKIDNLGSKMAALAGVMASLVIFAAPINQARAFESSLADLNKVLEFELPDGLQTTAAAIQELSNVIPIAATGLVDIATAGAQLGVLEGDIIKFTETVSKISVAFDIMPGEAGDAVAKLSNIFEIPVNDFELFADRINLVSNNTASAADEIVRALQNKGAAAGRIMGLQAEQTMALASTFIQLGVNASRVGSIMDSMSRRLSDASIVGEDFAQRFAAKPQEELLKLLRTIKGLKGVKKANALSKVFGEFSGRVGILADTMDERLIPTLELATNAQAALGSVQEEFNVRSKTTDAKLTILSNKFNRLAVNIGTIMLPAVNGVATVLGFVSDVLVNVTEATGPLIPMLIAAAGAMAVAAGAAAIFGIALGWPIALIIGAVAGAVIGIGWLIDKVEELGGIANVFKMIGNAIIDGLVFPLRLAARAIDAVTGTDLTAKLDAITSNIKFDIEKPSPEAIAGTTNKSESVVDINLNAPSGVIQSTEIRSKGVTRTNVGQNMALGAT